MTRVTTDQSIIAFVAHGSHVQVHQHHCFQIVVSITRPFDCVIGQRAYTQKTGFIINQNIPHSCMAQDASVLVYFVDAESYYGRQLKALLGGVMFMDTDPFCSDAQRTASLAADQRLWSKDTLHALANDIFDRIVPAPDKSPHHQIDERVLKAVAYIEAHLHEPLRLEPIAELMYLSPQRARHLFAQDTGIPFSQFVLWKRLKHVITLVVRDQFSLTDAALESGFADQAHLCRTFKRMFGISAKTHLKNSRFVQFLNPVVEYSFNPDVSH